MAGRVAKVAGWVAAVALASAPHAADADRAIAGAPAWRGRASVSAYFLPGEPGYLVPIVSADRGALHLEGRYASEDRETVSALVGANLRADGDVTLLVQPMLGLALGRTDGVVPELDLAVGWGPLQYYGSVTLVVSLARRDASYLCLSSELTASPVEWLRAGLALQRTRFYQAPREVSAGAVVGAYVGRFGLSAYWYSPGEDGQYAELSGSARF